MFYYVREIWGWTEIVKLLFLPQEFYLLSYTLHTLIVIEQVLSSLCLIQEYDLIFLGNSLIGSGQADIKPDDNADNEAPPETDILP